MFEQTRDSRDSAGMPSGYLTETSLFRLEYMPVPPALAQHITVLYHFSCDEPEIRDVQPAALGHLALFPHGDGMIHFRDGQSDPTRETIILSPTSVAAPFTVAGPFHAIGAALSPLGWAELTGLNAAEHGNRMVEAGTILGEALSGQGAQWCAAYREGTMSGADCAAALAQWIGQNLRPLLPQHRHLIGQTMAWLTSGPAPDLDALYARLPVSRRQAQRLVERYFGLSPTGLRRKYRALRAAAILSQPDLDPQAEAAIVDCFYDQPHMIREIRLFAGRTPARLSDAPDSFLTEMLDLRNLRELGPRPAAGAKR